jgi:hypothetical protein
MCGSQLIPFLTQARQPFIPEPSQRFLEAWQKEQLTFSPEVRETCFGSGLKSSSRSSLLSAFTFFGKKFIEGTPLVESLFLDGWRG